MDKLIHVILEHILIPVAGQYCTGGEELPCASRTICKSGRTKNNGEDCESGATCDQTIKDGFIWGAVVSIACSIG